MTDFKERIANLSPKRLALLAVELQKKLERAEARASEPIAVLGVGCRFPGGANGADGYWRMLSNGVDAIRDVPPDRWDIDALYDPDPKAVGKMVCRSGGFIDDVDRFDAGFFGITPREATSLDPRYRILLEVVWETLEHAGQAPDGLSGSRTGVYVGACGSDYYQLLVEGRPGTLDAYLVSGIASSMAAGRISYALGLQGPAMSVDTACSSSLVAVHLACQSLRSGECDLAIAAGTSLLLVPEVSIGLSKAEMLSPDGRCKTFDAAADGIARGEGCGAVVLKRLSDVDAGRDRVLAVIRGTAINQDGRSGGITAPNGPSQEAVIREALKRSGLRPADVEYVETHGTGTPLGDPVEARALDAALREGREQDRPVRIGSVKTNIGHLEASAGIAALIKVVLALQQERIPAHLHLHQPSTHIEWDEMCLAVPTEATAWPRGNTRRIAGVSSFGFSGTNAHVIAEEAPDAAVPVHGQDRPLHILTVSAKTATGLDTSLRQLAEDLAAHPDRPVADVGYTANVGRARFEERAAVVGASPAELAEGLVALAERRAVEDGFRGAGELARPPDVVFLFGGRGSLDSRSGRGLYDAEPRFRDAVDACDRALQPLLGQSVVPLLFPDDATAAVDDLRCAHAAAFVLQYSLAQLWLDWGVTPGLCLGYDVGEYVAACVAGVFAPEDALGLVVKRAELAMQYGEGQALAAVAESAELAVARIVDVGGALRIAAVNGPSDTVVAGSAEDIARLVEACEADGVRAQSLPSVPTSLAGPALRAFETALSAVRLNKPAFGLLSMATGRIPEPGEVATPKYWSRQASDPIRFFDAIGELADGGPKLILEVGSNPVLAPLARRFVTPGDADWLATLRDHRVDWRQLLHTLAALYVRGVNVDWRKFHAGRPGRVVSLPTYPFERKRYWVSVPAKRETPDERPPWQDWLYEFAWRRIAGSPGNARDLNGPQAISESTSAQIEALAEEHGTDVYRSFAPRLDELCSAYILRALRKLGWETRTPSGLFTVAEVLAELKIVPRHERLLRRMLGILAEDGVLEPAGDGWQWAQMPESQDAGALASELVERYPECAAELDLTIDCGRELAAVLRGTADPMQLLFPGGSLSPTERLYQESAGLRLFNSLVREAIVAACGDTAPDRKLRILEIGAGTGAATSYVLPVLDPQRTEYTFTDVSNAFLAAAAEKFSDYPFVEYRLLDAGEDPRQQGFEDQAYDIVVAANVLHATPELRRTLEHVRRLLVPEGLVVLLEGTVRQRFGDLTVGLTPGWWSFTDTDLRPDYALLTAPQWRDLLGDCGFASVASIPDGDHPLGGAVNQQSVLVARTAAAAEDAQMPPPGDWMVLCDEQGQGDALADCIRAAGGGCVIVRKGESFADEGDDSFIMDPADADGFRRLFDLLGNKRRSLRGAIHCWALDEVLADDVSLPALDRAQQRACGSALHLAQALASMGGEDVPRLVLLTREAQAVAPGEACPGFAQASLWGLARVIELEHPELRTVTADLDSQPHPAGAKALLSRVLAEDCRENQLALRREEWRVLRAAASETMPPADRRGVEIGDDACYLITGGLGGLGLLVADWLAERGAGRLVLMGRRPPGDAASATIDRIRAAGTEVQVVSADVADADAVDVLKAAIGGGDAPLRGIFHCAGALDDGALLQQDWSRFGKVMAAKVRGSWNLHRLGESGPVEFFVLFSSGASFLGSPGQSNHAAANAFMDALACYRRGSGRPALTINWGPWSETGAAVRTGAADHAATAGMGTISPQRGLAILEYLMAAAGRTQVAVLPASAGELVGHRHRDQSLPVFEELAQLAPRSRIAETAAATPESGPGRLLESLQNASPAARRGLLLQKIQQAAQQTMGLSVAEPVDPRRPLTDLGLDSLMAVELRNAVGALVGKSLPATLLFNYPSIGELVEHLLDDVLEFAASGERASTAAGEASPEDVRDEQLNELGEDELADLLKSKLADMDEAG